MPVLCSNYGELCITSGYSQKILFARAIRVSAILKTITVDDLLISFPSPNYFREAATTI